ncbi:hypothetical protein Tco_1276362 [Tanacetum coccineum]
MFLNMDQLEKQLHNEEFQEIGSMNAFKVPKTQFQMFIKSRIYLDDEYVVMTRNYFLQYTQLEILEFCDTLMQHMVYVKKLIDKRALHKRERAGQMGESKTDAGIEGKVVHIPDTAYIMKEPMAEYHTNAESMWVPTGKIFTSSTTKVDSEPTNGSNDDITNQHECEQTLDVSAAMNFDHNNSELRIHDHNNEPSSSKLVPKVVPLADKTATS